MADWADDDSDSDDAGLPLQYAPRRRFQLFVIDARSNMLAASTSSGAADAGSALSKAFDVIQESLRQYIIEGSSLLRTGVVLAGCLASKGPGVDAGIYELVPCAPPSVDGVQAVRRLAAAAAAHTDASRPIRLSHVADDPGLGAGDAHSHLPLLGCLNYAASAFQKLGKDTDDYTVIIFTNDATPLRTFSNGALIKCADMRDSGYRVLIQPVGVLPASFNAAAFWDAVSSSPVAALHEEEADYEQTAHAHTAARPGNLRAGGGVLPPLSSDVREAATNMRRRIYAPRAFAHLPLTLSPGIHLSIQIFRNISAAKKPTATQLDANTGQVVKRFTRYVRIENPVDGGGDGDDNGDMGAVGGGGAGDGFDQAADDLYVDGENPSRETEEVSKGRILNAMTDKVTDKRVVFSQADAIALKSFAGPDSRGLRIIGFQDRSSLSDVANIEAPSMVYPYEQEIKGSTQVFAALWQTLIQKDKIAIARYVRTQGSEPKFVALVPERERTHATGKQEMPPCLYAVTLPFAQDQRAISADNVDIYCADVEPDHLDAARALVRALQRPDGFDLLRSPPSNPRLQVFYATLEGLALNLQPDQVRVPRDESVIDPSTLSAEQRGAITAFDNLTRAVEPVRAVPKRKRAA